MQNNKQTARRGRPAKLSREQILEAALKLLEKGAADVTLNGVARALNASPMSLYTHVDNRDDLLLGVSERVLGQLTLQLDAVDWEANVHLWVNQVQAHFKRYPQIVKLLGEGQALSLEWVRLESHLVRTLAQSGLCEAEQVSTANIISQAVIFDCIIATGQPCGPPRLHLPDLAALPDAERHAAEQLYRHTPATGHCLLQFVLSQALQRARTENQQHITTRKGTGE